MKLTDEQKFQLALTITQGFVSKASFSNKAGDAGYIADSMQFFKRAYESIDNQEFFDAL